MGPILQSIKPAEVDRRILQWRVRTEYELNFK